MIRLVPAVLRSTFDEVLADVSRVADVAPYVQIDITDGKFVENTTWPYVEGAGSIDDLQRLTVPFELDLMIENPESVLPEWLKTSAQRIIIHYASTNNLDECIRLVKNSGKEVAVAISTTDSVEALTPYLTQISAVQCMGIAHIGVQGEPYDNRVEGQVAAVRSADSSLEISVDGAQSMETMPRLAELGVTQFCVGSAIFSGEAEARYAELREFVDGLR